jgi:hypothetical protein
MLTRLAFRSNMGLLDEIAVGQEFWGVLAELCIDPATKRLRVRSLPNQVFPEGVFIECSKEIRVAHSIGTIFKVNVGVSSKPTGRLYAHSLRKNELLTESEWAALYG